MKIIININTKTKLKDKSNISILKVGYYQLPVIEKITKPNQF
jgi:hypothetical protein